MLPDGGSPSSISPTRRRLVWRWAGSLTILLAAAAVPANAQEPELQSDRPDFTESAVVVPAGSVQLEGGATWIRGSGGRDVLGGPELLLRWGLSRSVELRLIAPDRVWDDAGDGVDGFTDVGAAAKLQLARGAAGWDVALIATAFIPTGTTGLTSTAVDPELAVTAARDLAPRLSLGGQITAAWPTVDGARRMAAVATLVLGAEASESASRRSSSWPLRAWRTSRPASSCTTGTLSRSPRPCSSTSTARWA